MLTCMVLLKGVLQDRGCRDSRGLWCWEDSFFLEGPGMSLELERWDGVGGIPRSGNVVSISFRVCLIICLQMPASLSGTEQGQESENSRPKRETKGAKL